MQYLISIIMTLACPLGKAFGINERIQAMDQTKQLNWVETVQAQAIEQSTGTYEAHDKQNIPVTLEWQILNVQSPSYAPTLKQISDIAAQAFTEVESNFLRAYPGAVATERLHQQLAPLFQGGPLVVDWTQVEHKIYGMIHHMYSGMDWSKFGTEDAYIIVTARDQGSNQLIGFITFFIRPAYPAHSCKVTSMGVLPGEQNRGVGKLLIASIFNILEGVDRIFLCTRVTNTKALIAYRSWGFVEDQDPVQEAGHTFDPAYWVFMTYPAAKTNTLQSIAKTA